MPLNPAQLETLVQNLSRRPGHDSVKAELHRLLVSHFNADPNEIFHEERIETRSRVDTLLGHTIFEIKRDLRIEQNEAQRQLERYITNRQQNTGQEYTGIATDGRHFIAYEIRQHQLVELSTYETDPTNPHSLPIWLEGIISLSPTLPADTLTVIHELGRTSAAYQRARSILYKSWDTLKEEPNVRLKRDLWRNHLKTVYGTSQDDDDLWFQHTFLVIVAKSFAHCLLQISPNNVEDVLSGQRLENAGITGAIESDFFDWVLHDNGSRELVNRIYERVQRFRLNEVGTDLLKVLYESLIDPKQRHDLGEYYTPDWLASRITEKHIDAPLTQHVLDPACGSGTFLFHAIRHLRSNAQSEGYAKYDVLILCLNQVYGIDVHPVAIIIARVTYLLALGREVLNARHGDISIPIFLGDAMQWNVRPMMSKNEIVLQVPPEKPGNDPQALEFPSSVVDQPQTFERILNLLVEASERDIETSRLKRQISREKAVDQSDLDTLARTYNTLSALQRAGRDHIWTFVARNMARPLWLSQAKNIDRVIGNPPWLSFRYMTEDMKRLIREGMKLRTPLVSAP